MTGNDIQGKVLALLGEHIEDASVLDAPVDDIELMLLGIHSADMINVIISVEDTFDLDVEDEYVHKLRTVGDIVRAIEQAQGPAGS